MADDKLKSVLFGMKPKLEAPVETTEPDESQMQDVGPCGWVWVKGCKALDIERGGDPVVSFQFVYLGMRSEYTPGKFWVEFVGLQTWRVTVEGRNLRAIYDRLQDHCLRRMRQADRDFGGEGDKPVVSRISVEDVTPKEG